jgi:hypothetical protein
MAGAPTPQATLSPALPARRETVYRIDPLRDARWPAFVDRHPRSSVFHTRPWLESLHRTYGFQPVVYTTSPPGAELENGMAFSRVTSWITGRRLISLPFSDHCEPLVDGAADLPSLANALAEAIRTERLRYIEVRARLPLDSATESCLSTRTYCFHELDLRPDLDSLFAKFHKSSTQRKILRAEREGLGYECGRSQALLNAFWDLLLITRRRHGLPPQPRAWFQNLIDCFGDALQIRVAFQARQPAAAILTIRHKYSLVYKYVCSDTHLNHLGGTQLLFWRSIQEARGEGLLAFDLGRSDSDNPGLITFKDRLGATRSTLTYSRFSPSPDSGAFGTAGAGWAGRIASRLAPRLPDRLLRLAGSVLYKHIA